MSNAPIVIAENISKCYIVKEQQQVLRNNAGVLLRMFRPRPPSESGGIWALRDVSFSVELGEAFGIVGANGAGKSTLLRVLSRITAPTTGRVCVNGTFATLIALGAGFDSERSGRENIYLNAAIQGKQPPEIKQLEREIIAFSELEEFIDLPIKRYSTGMRARLGFSIAVHILPDIIFLDEVLSVGDTAFQNKSRDRMIAFREERRTLLLVSHNLDTIEKLCDRCLWLERGKVRQIGATGEVIDSYRADQNKRSTD